jgi:hypothetical protein
VSSTFKVFAWLTLIGGAITSFSAYNHLTSIQAGDPLGAAIGIAAGAILGASAFAFFGYVLDLLTASVLEARRRQR